MIDCTPCGERSYKGYGRNWTGAQPAIAAHRFSNSAKQETNTTNVPRIHLTNHGCEGSATLDNNGMLDVNVLIRAGRRNNSLAMGNLRLYENIRTPQGEVDILAGELSKAPWGFYITRMRNARSFLDARVNSRNRANSVMSMLNNIFEKVPDTYCIEKGNAFNTDEIPENYDMLIVLPAKFVR